MKKNHLSTLILLLAAIIWGYAFVAQVKGAEHMQSFTFNAIRFSLGATSLIPVILIFERDLSDKARLKKTFIYAVMAGVALFSASTLQQIGADITGSSGVCGFMTALYNVLTPIAYFLIFKKKTAINVWISACISIVGLFMLCITDEGLKFGVGELCLLIGTLFWTAHILIVDKFVSEVYTLKFASCQFYVCAGLSGIFSLIFERASYSVESVQNALPAILYCGLLSVGVAYTLQIIGQKYSSNPTTAAMVLSTESVFSAIGGAQFGTDSIPMIGYFGCVVIFIAIILAQLPESMFERKNDKKKRYEE